MYKKLVSAVLVILLLVCVMSTSAFAWDSFRGSDSNMGITDAETPRDANEASLKWTQKFGTDWSDAASAMITVNGKVYVMNDKTLFELSCEDGEILKSADLATSTSYGAAAPLYNDGVLYIVMGTGTVQAFDAETFESLWIYQNANKGQGLSQLSYDDGYLYTGFYNGETKSADFVCINAETGEEVWTYANVGGFYSVGAAVVDGYVVVMADNGADEADQETQGRVLSLDKDTGSVADSFEVVGDGRSLTAFDEESGRLYFTSKGGYMYSAKLDSEGKFDEVKSCDLKATTTAAPVVYDDYAYVGLNNKTIVSVDIEKMEIAGSVDMIAYPQCSLLLSEAYEDEGYVYLYSTYNAEPGGITVIKANIDDGTMTSSELYDASGYENYCICSVISDDNGTLYYKNDSGNIFAISKGSNAVSEAEIEDVTVDVAQQAPAVNAFVSISVAGEIVKDKDGNMLYKAPVTAQDLDSNGVVSIEEVLFEAHEQYFEGGAAEGYEAFIGDYGTSLSMLWGDTSFNFGYYLNNGAAWSLDDAVSDNGYVYAYVYQDVGEYTESGYSDMYTFFERDEYSADGGNETELTLNGLVYDSDAGDYVSVPAVGVTVRCLENDEICGITDENGKVKLNFASEGDYEVIAESTVSDESSVIVVPSVCTVSAAQPQKEAGNGSILMYAIILAVLVVIAAVVIVAVKRKKKQAE